MPKEGDFSRTGCGRLLPSGLEPRFEPYQPPAQA